MNAILTLKNNNDKTIPCDVIDGESSRIVVYVRMESGAERAILRTSIQSIVRL